MSKLEFIVVNASSPSCFLGHSLCDQNMDKWERFQLAEKDEHLLQLRIAPEQKMQPRLLIRNQRSVLRESRNLPRNYIRKWYISTIVLTDKSILSMDMYSTAAFWYQWGLEWNILILLETGKNQCFEKKLRVVGEKCFCRRSIKSSKYYYQSWKIIVINNSLSTLT